MKSVSFKIAVTASVAIVAAYLLFPQPPTPALDQTLAQTEAIVQTTATGDMNINQEITQIRANAPANDLSQTALREALTAYDKADDQGKVKVPYLTVIDYSLPSNQKRMWVIHMKDLKVPYHTYTAHGKNSGTHLQATTFSNTNQSKESNLGIMITRNPYYGHKGYALRMVGLEKGINSNALSRDIVVHGAAYANPSFVKKMGYTGRSWGCPSVPVALAKPIIDHIKNGSVVFGYYPNKAYENTSQYV